MGEEVAVAHTNAEVQAIYQKAQQFDQARDWNIPSYAWDVAHIKQLQQMSLDSIINHLRQLIAAKLGMEDLQRQLEQQTRSETDHFNSALAEQKKQLKRYPGLFIEFQKSSVIPRFTRDCAALVFHPLGAPIC
ncbi:hypothetical protein [Lacticaseibacillus sp. 866-1]|uniref:hypothetical protein n=1 Tax=Lacticaseibacillus sp. 866-1 TaxID=2799576 RepID=UPI001941EFA9|nr:hypothetical protein [Lacticaseibacillus sp. 866-1]